jgi:hypothetical protein
MGNLTLVPHEQPGAGKKLLFLMIVYLWIEKYIPAHESRGVIDPNL